MPATNNKSDSTANLGFEAQLWQFADALRNNIDAAEYKHVALGLIFLKDICSARALGLETSISPHDFRRYIATTLLSEGMPLESVQSFLGHESIVTMRTVYAHTWNEVLEDQVKTYRPSPGQALRRARKKQSNDR